MIKMTTNDNNILFTGTAIETKQHQGSVGCSINKLSSLCSFRITEAKLCMQDPNIQKKDQKQRLAIVYTYSLVVKSMAQFFGSNHPWRLVYGATSGNE